MMPTGGGREAGSWEALNTSTIRRLARSDSPGAHGFSLEASGRGDSRTLRLKMVVFGELIMRASRRRGGLSRFDL